jgi:guanylate kinase
MGKIFIIIGKSASGKDTIYSRIINKNTHSLKKCVMYTTRPMRVGEVDGNEYFFVDENRFNELKAKGKVIEHRTYNTAFGPWHYFTADDGQFDDSRDCLMPGTIESFCEIKKYFEEGRVVPIYVYVDDYERLLRALEREHSQKNPGYVEMCRRFVADSQDFSEENIKRAGIEKIFVNDNLDICIQEIIEFIEQERKNK